MARPELPGAAAPIQSPVSPFRWAAHTRFSNLLPKCSFIFRMVVVYWSWNCESCPEIKYFSLFLRTALLFQLIPARGRKPYYLDLYVLYSTFQLIPARGRKPIKRNIGRRYRLRFQLIPARGRKRFTRSKRVNQAMNFNLSPQNPLRRCAPALPKGELL